MIAYLHKSAQLGCSNAQARPKITAAREKSARSLPRLAWRRYRQVQIDETSDGKVRNRPKKPATSSTGLLATAMTKKYTRTANTKRPSASLRHETARKSRPRNAIETAGNAVR